MSGRHHEYSVLVVEDDPLMRDLVQQRIERAGYATVVATDAAQALRAFGREKVDLALVGDRLPDGDGLSVLQRLREQRPDLPVVVLTAHATVERAVDAMAGGACYFLSKPVDFGVLLRQIGNALECKSAPCRTEPGRSTARSGVEAAADPLIAVSKPMLQVKAVLERIGMTAASTILLTGESGVGKDCAARFLHASSPRAKRPFINITCSALPEQLLESELFGYERGAFTDAKQRKIGLLEQADGGTVFLDEIGEITPALQAKLLRFLEERAFRRVGGDSEIRPDVRVVAATNRDLRKAVAEGEFRHDLFYRLAVLHVRIPPLRERQEDIEVLARHFVVRYGRLFHSPVRTLQDGAIGRLVAHPWPGNVRELKNVIERAVLMTDREALSRADLVFEPPVSEGCRSGGWLELPPEGLDLDQLERDLLMQALDRTRGNKTRAAALLGLTRDQIRHRVEKHGIDGSAAVPSDDAIR